MENLKSINWDLEEKLNIEALIENSINDGVNEFEHIVGFENNGLKYNATLEINVSIDELVECDGVNIFNTEYDLTDVSINIVDCFDNESEQVLLSLKQSINISNQLAEDFKLFF
jgi:hypothetical protein